MNGPKSPDIDDLLEQLDWGSIRGRLVLFAARRLGTRGKKEDAEEFADEAIVKFLDHRWADWDPVVDPDAKKLLGSILNGDIQNWLRSGAKKRLVFDTDVVDTAGGASSDIEARAVELDLYRKVVAVLMDRVSRDPQCNQLFLLMLSGVSDSRDQAREMGCSVTEVYNARRRLFMHVERARKDVGVEVTNG